MTWRWPWVSRERYDADLARADAHVAQAHQLVDRYSAIATEAARKYADLVERVLQMRREGFQPPAEPTPDTPPAPSLPVAVQDAIEEVAVNEPMARQLRATAMRLLRQEGGDEAKVAKLIRDGEDPELLEVFP